MNTAIQNISLPTIQLENFMQTIFKPIKFAYETGATKIVNMLLIEMITALKNQDTAILKEYNNIETDPQLAIDMDTEEFHDTMLELQDTMKVLLKKVGEYKGKSELFDELYIVVDELYTNILTLTYDVSRISSELEHEQKLAS